MFTGDGPGDDAGVHTKVIVRFNPIRVVLRQQGDCLPPQTARAQQVRGQLSRRSAARLAPALRTVPPDVLRLPPRVQP